MEEKQLEWQKRMDQLQLHIQKEQLEFQKWVEEESLALQKQTEIRQQKLKEILLQAQWTLCWVTLTSRLHIWMTY